MTQLVAAVADSGNAIVAVSDRMVSTADMTLGFESPNRKAEAITATSAVLLAGTLYEADLIRDAREKARGKERIRDIAEVFANLYSDLRAGRIEQEVLRARVGIKSFAEYHQKQSMLHESVIFDTNEKIRNYEVGLYVILVGIDDHAHIFHVTDPGVCRSHDNLGWCTAGMGDRHAENVFAWYRYSSNTPLNEALYIAFEAKKKAEMAGGVGSTTDALIVSRDGISLVENSTMQELAKIYEDREHGAQRKTFDKRITELQLQTTKLTAA